VNRERRRHRGWVLRFPMRRGLLYLVLGVGAVLSLWPFYWMVLTSLRSYSQYYTWPPNLLPTDLTTENYQALFRSGYELALGKAKFSLAVPFYVSLENSFIIALGYVLLGLFLCSLAGFAFAKYDFPGKGVLFFLLLASMMIPQFVILIPLYVMMSRLHLVNTYIGIILPFVANAFGIFWMRQYMSTLPNELIDAAVVDGASPFQIYRKIILPLSRPALAALGFFFFMSQWNDFLWPFIMLTSERKYTMPIFLQNMQRMVEITPYPLIMAGSTIAVIPLLIGFAIMQEQFISGLTAGSLRQ
jgi:ABC-type glycerol-3-phosphate transport system permease component